MGWKALNISGATAADTGFSFGASAIAANASHRAILVNDTDGVLTGALTVGSRITATYLSGAGEIEGITAKGANGTVTLPAKSYMILNIIKDANASTADTNDEIFFASGAIGTTHRTGAQLNEILYVGSAGAT